VHATISPEKCIEHCDLVCVGEGEGAILDLVKNLEKNKKIFGIKNLWVRDFETQKPTNIRLRQKPALAPMTPHPNKLGVSKSTYNDKGKIIKNDVRPVIENLDELPFVDYDLKNHFVLEGGVLRKFSERDLDGCVFFLTGRGCPYGCEYCSNNLFNKLYKGKCKNIVRWHSPEYIIDCILDLKKRFKSLSYFDIRDDTFLLRPLKDIKKFCELYKEKVGMRFKCLGDPKTVSEDKIKLLVDAGCTDIIIGIQGVERVNREVYHRNQTDEHVIRASKILSKYKNLAVMYDVITCNPYEKAEDVLNMIKLLMKLEKPYYLSVNNLVFFPGSGLYDRAIKDADLGVQVEKSWKLNYWDRSKHILLKKKNMYLVLVLNLMRGSVSHGRYGLIPGFVLKWLINEKRIERNLKNHGKTLFALKILEVMDFLRENLFKKVYRAIFPVWLKVIYDKVRYRL